MKVALDKKDVILHNTQEYEMYKQSKRLFSLANPLNNVVIMTFPGGKLVKKTKSLLVDLVSLASNIGGGLGLALGISCLSVLEYIVDKGFKQ